MKAYLGLSCKTGVYHTVLEELLDLNIPKGDIFLLFGPVDILVQLNFKSLDEFIEKWFNPIRMIGAEEALITKTLTFIVYSEGQSFAEEPFAFAFLYVQPRNIEKVQKALSTVPEVLSADAVFGPYDVICPVRAKDREDLERIISHIQNNVPDIEGTMTAIAAILRI